MISCILLSAGLSSRFGSPKALAVINESTVIEHLLQTMIESVCGEIMVVLGSEAKKIESVLSPHKKVSVIYNKDFMHGQTSSFKTGIRHISSQATGILLIPVDYPLVATETINSIIAVFQEEMPEIVIPTYKEKKGHPPVFNISLKTALLGLPDSCGINTLVREHHQRTHFVDVTDRGVVQTFNTPEEFSLIKKQK